MKIYEINLMVGKRYKCSDGQVYEVMRCHGNTDLEDITTKSSITDRYYLSRMFMLEFEVIEDVVDWSKVEVDTKIEVWDETIECWRPKHFCRYSENDGHIIAWAFGNTSHTTNDVTRWEKGRLVKKD